MPPFSKTPLNIVRRVAERGEYDRKAIYEIVDDALLCHVGFVADAQPFVIPTIHARDGDTILLHGAKASRLLKHVKEGHPVCITCTHLDGLVMARSVFHHSMNYRSAVLFGHGHAIEDEDEKMHAFQVLTDHIMPGRWKEARHPNAKEMNATTLVRVSIDSASAKTRSGPVGDDEEDYMLPVWAGVMPVERRFLDPQEDARLASGVDVPEYIRSYHRGKRNEVGA